MSRSIDIKPEHRAMLVALFEQHLPNVTAWAYGSRVNGNARPSSDLDLVVFSNPGQQRQVSELREALEESSLPMRVDLFVWNEIPESFRSNIQDAHAVLIGPNNSDEKPAGDITAAPNKCPLQTNR